MNPIDNTKFTVDATQAITTVEQIQTAFRQYNSTLGELTAQTTRFNAKAAAGVSTLTQIDAAGRKVISTIRETANGYEILSVKVAAATASQRRQSEEMLKQRTLAESLAKSITQRQTMSTFPIQFPADVGDTSRSRLEALSKISRDQMVAAMRAIPGASQQQIDLFGKLPEQARTAVKAIDTVSAAARRMRARLHEAGQIAFATMIYRSLSLLQTALADGTKSAIDFSKQIGLIQTLDGGANTFNEWASAIRKVSDEFGQPVVDVAAAAYEGLSSQVVKTASDMDLLREATALGRATASSTTESMQIMAAVINSFGKEAGNAQQISSKLFTTVDLGNVKLGELGSVIGQTNSLAKPLGATFDEIAAGLIVLTNQGLNSAEAGTVMSNVFNQLTKPNEALTAQLHEMGFANAQAAIETLGFAGVMQKLHEAVAATGESVAKFFPEIRGFRGVSTFNPEGLIKYNAALKELQEQSNRTAEATKTLNENPGFSLEKEIQEIKNFFTVDLGDKAIGVVARLTQAFGGLKQIIEDYGNTLGNIVTMTGTAFAVGTLGNFALKLWDAAKAAGGLAAAFAKIPGIGGLGALAIANPVAAAGIAAFTAAVVGGSFAWDWYAARQREAMDSVKAEIEKAKNAELDALKEVENARVAADKAAITETSRAAQEMIAERRRANNELLKELTKSGKDAAKNLSSTFSAFMKAEQESIDSITRQAEKYENSLRGIAELRRAATQNFQERQFDRSYSRATEYGDIGAAAEIGNARIRQLQSEMQQGVKLGDTDKITKAFESIDAVLEKMRGTRGLMVDDRAFQTNYKQYMQALSSTTPVLQKKAAETNKLAYEAQNTHNELNKIVDAIKNIDKATFDKDGNLIERLIGDTGKARRELTELFQQFQQFAKQSAVIPKAGFNTEIPINQQFKDAQSMLERLGFDSKEFQDRANKYINNYSERVGVSSQNTDLENQRANVVTEEKRLKDALDSSSVAMQKATAEAKTHIAEMQTLLESMTRTMDAPKRFLGLIPSPSAMSADVITNTLNNIRDSVDTQGTDLKIEQIQKYIDTVKSFAQTPLATNGVTILDPTDSSRVIELNQGLNILLDKLNKLVFHQNNVATASAGVVNIRTEYANWQSQVDATTGSISNNANVTLQANNSIIGSVNSVSLAYAALAQQIAAAVAASAGLGGIGGISTAAGGAAAAAAVSYYSTGGEVNGTRIAWLSDFFSGKFAKGTDIYPAMLTKKEVVVRAPMAEKYNAQLRAMNAGLFPLSQSSPGNTTTVGDIYVQMTHPQASPKDFARELRRGIRQGTVRLR